MAKYFIIFLLAFVIAVGNAQALSNRVRSGRVRFLARQQLASGPTPYPSADDLKPEVPFEETAATPQAQELDLTYGAPDLSYGPPEFDQSPTLEEEQLPSEDAPEEFAPPGDVEEFSSVELNSGIFSRLTSSRRQNGRKQLHSTRNSLRLAKIQQQRQQKTITARSKRLTDVPLTSLVSAPVTLASLPTTVVSPSLQASQYFVLNQPLAYTVQYQSW